MDDIDSLLADMQPPSKGRSSHRQNDDIDSLLADLGNNNNNRKGAKSCMFFFHTLQVPTFVMIIKLNDQS